MAQNVIFIRGNTAKINSTAIADGQLLYDTTTGQHYIDNESTRVEVGKPVVNTMAEVSAITEPNIPCGTLAVKELNSNFHITKATNLTALNNGQTYTATKDGMYMFAVSYSSGISNGEALNDIVQINGVYAFSYNISGASWFNHSNSIFLKNGDVIGFQTAHPSVVTCTIYSLN